MSKCIRVEWLMAYFAQDVDYYGPDVRFDIENNIPTIDIVRCGECKYYKFKGACMRLDRKILAVRPNDFCSCGERNCSEKPNNCEHITEDGVTCAKYPACDDCLDNPLNKVKGSKRLLKGKDEPQTNADQHIQHVESVESDEQTERSE